MAPSDRRILDCLKALIIRKVGIGSGVGEPLDGFQEWQTQLRHKSRLKLAAGLIGRRTMG